MRTVLLIVSILFFTTACSNKKGIPGNVLSQKKMQGVMWDLMRADQFMADYVLNKDTSLDKTTESLKYYRQIFAIHKISKEEFQRSFSFYSTHPGLLKEIMDSINAPVSQAPTELAKPELTPGSPATHPDTLIKYPSKRTMDTSVIRRPANNY